MKVGMIFECGPAGADKIVCELLASRLKPDIEIVSATLDNKKTLLAECGLAAADLLKDSCQRIVIVWDLYPPWRKDGQRPCRREDRIAIGSSLKKAGVKFSHVHLVCIREELETWLIADGRAISEILSSKAHPIKIKDTKDPERIQKPKTRLIKLFRENIGRPYSDLAHAKRIVEALPDLNRIKYCASFVRFAAKVKGSGL